LAARGEYDPIVSEESLVALSKIVKNVQLFTISSAGHEAIVEQPEKFAAELVKFFR